MPQGTRKIPPKANFSNSTGKRNKLISASLPLVLRSRFHSFVFHGPAPHYMEMDTLFRGLSQEEITQWTEGKIEGCVKRLLEIMISSLIRLTQECPKWRKRTLIPCTMLSVMSARNRPSHKPSGTSCSICWSTVCGSHVALFGHLRTHRTRVEANHPGRGWKLQQCCRPQYCMELSDWDK